MKFSLPQIAQKQEYIPFTGGLDVVTPPVMIPPGKVRRSFNFYEDINGGYATVSGYERFDGHVSPSQQGYLILPFTVQGSVAVGNTITGVISGATGKVIAITPAYFVLTRVTGTFTNETTTSYGATLKVNGMASAIAGQLGAQYKNLAANEYRSSIGVVPGSGAVLGVWYYKGTVYAFRNNSGGTAVGMYASSPTGWQAVNLGYEIYFAGGSGIAPVEGATITKGGVSAVIGRVVIESGTFAAGTAMGRFVVLATTGGAFTAGAFTGGVTATCISQNAITIPNIGGRYEFITTNFYGQLGSSRMYGCDGLNRGFEFDGTIFTPINTGMGNTPIDVGGGTCSFATNVMTVVAASTRSSFAVGQIIYAVGVAAGTTITAITSGTGAAGSTYTLSTTPGTIAAEVVCASGTLTTSDAPTHVQANQMQLFFAIGSSIMGSAITSPLNWQVLLGASTIACGDTVTGLKSQPGSSQTASMAVFCRNSTYILYGNGSLSTAVPWQLSLYNDQGGAIANSIQKIGGETYVLDDRGVTAITTAQIYGNFLESTISAAVQTLLASLRGKITDSHIARDAQQYRLFFSNGQALYFTLRTNPSAGTTLASPMLIQFPDAVRCSCSTETYGGGVELKFFGTDSGYVHQMEMGTSFDGASINTFLELAFDNSTSYRTIKHYRHMTFEAVGFGYSEFNASYYLGYNNAGDFAQPDNTFFGQDISQTNFWDEMTWDSFVWDGVSISSLSMATPGNGDNMAVVIFSNANYYAPIKFSGAFIEYSPLRNLR